MRVLVADDEQIVLDGLTKIIGEYDASITIKTVKSGREAIQAAETFHPDVIFMDIKMPGISGLEALEEIQRLLPQTISVILSAYEQFEFARSAIRLQVLDYLVKPIHKDRFLEVLRKARRILDERQSERSHILELRDKHQKLIPFFERDLVFRIISGIDTEESLALYQDLLNLPQGLCAFMVLQLQYAAEPTDEDRWGSEYSIHQHLIHLSDTIRVNLACLTGPVSTNHLTILFSLKESDEYQARLESVAAADAILRMVPADFEAAVGIGRACEFPSPNLSRSYQEALMALEHQQLGPIRHFMDIYGPEETDWELAFNEIEAELLEAVGHGQPERIKDILPNKFLSKVTLPSSEFSRMLQRCRELEILAVREARKYGFRSDTLSANLGEPTKETFQKNYLPRLQGWLITCARYIQENKEARLNVIVGAAKIYIDKSYANEALNLEEVARQVSVTPYYLSRLFHAEMGMTFTDYLTKARLDKAVALLQAGTSVKEICYQVGYNDPNYFSRLFRKVFGVPPTEYRKGG